MLASCRYNGYKYSTVHVMLQMLVVVKSAAAALTDIANESVQLLVAGALQLHGIQVSQGTNTILTGTHLLQERSFNPHEPQDAVPWLLLPGAHSTASCTLLLMPHCTVYLCIYRHTDKIKMVASVILKNS